MYIFFTPPIVLGGPLIVLVSFPKKKNSEQVGGLLAHLKQ